MSLISPVFLLFLLTLIIIYYYSPTKCRWQILLLASLVFYCWGGEYQALLYLLTTAFTTWFAAIIIDRISMYSTKYFHLDTKLNSEEKKVLKANALREKQKVLFFTLILNLLILGIVKYADFVVKNFLQIWNWFDASSNTIPTLKLLIPLGISFYTFQSLGYLIDVYRGQTKAEQNFAKYLLFVSYFPQIVQGPIGRYDSLAPQLSAPHQFHYENLKHGAILMLWGYVKKMVIADRIAPFVITVSKTPEKYDGSIIVVCVLFYTIQLYADFSGGIDIISGASQMFGIHLTSNFKRPYFATSLGDFWRRWHISLGAWMRDYVFYPFVTSKWVIKIAKSIKRSNKNLAKAFPAMVGNFLVFFIVGLWHGAEWKYIIWGIFNGMILSISILLEPLYSRFREIFPFVKTNPLWHVFQIARTFFIVWIGDFFDICSEIGMAFFMMKKAFFDFHISMLKSGDILSLGLGKKDYIILLLAVLLLFIISLFQEKGIEIRRWLNHQCIVVRWLLLYILLFFFISFSVTGTDAMEGFMYAIF